MQKYFFFPTTTVLEDKQPPQFFKCGAKTSYLGQERYIPKACLSIDEKVMVDLTTHNSPKTPD